MPTPKTTFISTSIPYVNADPHLGHAVEFVQADLLARARRLSGGNVFFTSGTDDNALKNVQAAEKAGQEVHAFVRAHAARFKELIAKLHISTDYFIETSVDPLHKAGAQKLWKLAEKDIYKKTYKGLYCIGCEEFKTEKELVNGECPEHPGTKLEEVEEENYFFRLSAYADALKQLINSGELRIVPDSRKNEVVSFIEHGLEDFSISRSVSRAKGWGIPVPGDDSQIQYVWFDALSNYVNALGYPEDSDRFQTYWNGGDELVHCIGKGITRFHAIYWPAMLLSAGVRPPTTIFVHGYITSDGQKMSKSLGNVISPFGLLDEYGTDAVRYFLLRHVHPFEDSDVTAEKFKEAYNAHLVNGIGNLTSRIMKMAETNLVGPVEIASNTTPQNFKDALDRYEIQEAADIVWERISALDKRIQETEPFKLVKVDQEKARGIIRELVVGLCAIAVMLEPILPETSEKIKRAVRANKMPEPLFARK
jgi:methionyl-tRNA synthetase